MVVGALLALALALEPPTAPTARVNDYAGLLDEAARQRLERTIAERERATGAQVAIAIFPSLAGGSVEDFSIRLAEQWRIGQKGLDNGVILVAFVQERKLRLEVGYGLEGAIPDIEAGRIIREAVSPRFRERRYAEGLEAAVQEIYARVGPGGAPARTGGGRGRDGGFGFPLVGFLVLLVIVVVVLGQEMTRSRRFVGRRGYTGGSGGWSGPVILPGPGWGGGGGGGSSDGGFSGGGGGFGGGGASGEW